MSIKGLPGRGIYGWDSASETWVKILIDSNGKIQITSTDLTSILADTDELQGDWADGGRLDALIDAIKAKTDNLPTDPADASNIAADFDRHLTPLDFWGDPIATVQISTSSATKSLGTITVPTLPVGATIWKVQLIGFISYIVDTSGSDNAINGAVSIQVQDDGGGSWKTGYDLQDNALMVDVSQSKVSPGIPIVGNLNNDNLGGSGYVDGADTYNVQITAVVSDGDNLDLYGLQFGLRIWIY